MKPRSRFGAHFLMPDFPARAEDWPQWRGQTAMAFPCSAPTGLQAVPSSCGVPPLGLSSLGRRSHRDALFPCAMPPTRTPSAVSMRRAAESFGNTPIRRSSVLSGTKAGREPHLLSPAAGSLRLANGATSSALTASPALVWQHDLRQTASAQSLGLRRFTAHLARPGYLQRGANGTPGSQYWTSGLVHRNQRGRLRQPALDGRRPHNLFIFAAQHLVARSAPVPNVGVSMENRLGYEQQRSYRPG